MTRKSSGRSSQDAEDAAAEPTRQRTSSATKRRTTEAAKARHKRAMDKKLSPEERLRIAKATPGIQREEFEEVIRQLVTKPPRKA